MLASGSPRRRNLLQQAGLSFLVAPSRFDEKLVEAMEPASYARTIAEGKARAAAAAYPAFWVLGADTIVSIDGEILGKPASRREAEAMLRRLSGRTHQVFTGYALCCRAEHRMISEAVATHVMFKSLSDAEIAWYVGTGEPMDKAGAYGIQGRGAFLIKRIEGSYTNVVGLPLCEVIESLRQAEILPFQTACPLATPGAGDDAP